MIVYEPITGNTFIADEEKIKKVTKEVTRRLNEALRRYDEDIHNIPSTCIRAEWDRIIKELEGG